MITNLLTGGMGYSALGKWWINGKNKFTTITHTWTLHLTSYVPQVSVPSNNHIGGIS